MPEEPIPEAAKRLIDGYIRNLEGYDDPKEAEHRTKWQTKRGRDKVRDKEDETKKGR
jgi:hypothetical protein